MKKVLTLISDKNYLEHAKSLFFAARTQGKWEHDLCLIANDIDDSLLDSFKKFGVYILKISEPNYYYANLHVFDSFFSNWEYVVSMDCDFTIFDDLNLLFNHELENSDCILVDKEPFTIKSYFCWGVENGVVKNEMCDGREEELNELYKKYDLDKYWFKAGFFGFNTKLINGNTLSELQKLSKELQHINFHTSENGSDQPILNLYFINNVKFIENRKISYWRHSDNNTIAQHHCRWDAPWVNNFYSDRLKKTYKQNYDDNLINFYASIR